MGSIPLRYTFSDLTFPPHTSGDQVRTMLRSNIRALDFTPQQAEEIGVYTGAIFGQDSTLALLKTEKAFRSARLFRHEVQTLAAAQAHPFILALFYTVHYRNDKECGVLVGATDKRSELICAYKRVLDNLESYLQRGSIEQ